MTTERTVVRTVIATPTSDGAGVNLKRSIGTPFLDHLDPFLLLDNIESDEASDYIAGFPDHPHRGFETVTYMVQGRMRHRDSTGGEGLLESGGAQWMTAGLRNLLRSGVVGYPPLAAGGCSTATFFVRSSSQCAAIASDPLIEVDGRLETNRLRCADRDRLSGARVPALAPTPLDDPESAEALKSEPPVLLERARDRPRDRVDRLLRLCRVAPGRLLNLF